jgi:hypothetical protein
MQRARQIEQIGRGIRRLRKAGNIAAAAEQLARAGQHHTAQRRIGQRLIHGLLQCLRQRHIDGVARLRAVQCHHGDGAIAVQQNGLVGHVQASMASRARRVRRGRLRPAPPPGRWRHCRAARAP